MRYKPETLIELSFQTENLRAILNSMASRYQQAVCEGRDKEWNKAMHAIIDCFYDPKHTKPTDGKGI